MGLSNSQCKSEQSAYCNSKSRSLLSILTTVIEIQRAIVGLTEYISEEQA